MDKGFDEHALEFALRAFPSSPPPVDLRCLSVTSVFTGDFEILIYATASP